MRALMVEFARLRRRRAVVMLTVLGLVGAIVILGFVVNNASPPSAAAKDSAQQQVDQQLADPQFQEQLQECQAAQSTGAAATSDTGPASNEGADESGQGVSGASSAAATAAPEGAREGAPAGAAATGGPSSDDSQWDVPPGMTCEDMMAPQVEMYLNWSPPQYVTGLEDNLKAVTMLLSLLLALAGVTFAGASWSAGTIGTQLLYEPRRTRVFAAKAGAMAIIGLVVGAIGAALAWVVSYAVAAKWGSTEMVQQARTFLPGNGRAMNPAPISGAELLGWAVRATTIVGLAAVSGYLLAMLFRSSTVAIAVLAGYLIAGEGVLGSLFRGIQPYLLSARISAWLDGPNQLVQYRNGYCDGSECDPTVTTISVAGGGVYLAILLAVGLVLTGFLFARRDVD